MEVDVCGVVAVHHFVHKVEERVESLVVANHIFDHHLVGGEGASGHCCNYLFDALVRCLFDALVRCLG